MGCTDPTLGPTDDGLAVPAPEFLLGGSPLIILDPTTPAVEVKAEVTRGLTGVPIPGKWITRTTVTFTVNGVADGTVGPQDTDLVGVKDEGVRRGDKVAIGACIEIPGNLWNKLVAADDLGATIEAKATVLLVMTDGAGKEHILDTEESTATVHPGS